ncbi:MAG: hypothetical protein HWE07_10285 [Cytophagia bacterium]|nr:hypothetical protein [Cytophagia bacterium]
MKKIITLLLLSIFSLANAQEGKLNISGVNVDFKSPDSETHKPYIQVNYQGKALHLGKFGNLDKMDPNWIQSISVLKDKSAVELFGKDGENGVILIDLKTTPEAKAYFEAETENYKGLTEIDEYQDASQRTFETEKRNQIFQGQTIRLRGETHQLQNHPLTIIQYNDQSLQLDEFSQLDEIGANYIKSVQVLKDELSIERYGAKDQGGVIILTMQSSKKAGKAFKKLKNALKKSK